MRKLEWTIVASLLAVTAGFPICQAFYEWLGEKQTPHVFAIFGETPTKKHLHGWDAAAKDRSIFSKWLQPRVLQLRYKLLGEMGAKSLKGTDGWLFYNQDVDYLMHPPYSDRRFYKGTFDTLVAGKRVNVRNPLVAITDFRDQLKARGIELLLIPIPGKPAIYPEKLWAGFRGQPPSPTLAMLEDLRRKGFQVVDLYHPLLEAKARGEGQLYLKRDTHWSPAGMEVAAAEIARAIRAMGILPADSAAAAGRNVASVQKGSKALAVLDTFPPSPRFVLKDTAVERWGDIAEMTKLPDRKKIWGTETVTARRVIDSRSGLAYADDEASPILWLGDSYSRIYQTDAPRGAGVIAHVSYRLQQPLASIVNDGGASTVVRQQLLNKARLLTGKKLVVWTFVERDIRFGSKGWQLEALP